MGVGLLPELMIMFWLPTRCRAAHASDLRNEQTPKLLQVSFLVAWHLQGLHGACISPRYKPQKS
jgi:hypothetical protein